MKRWFAVAAAAIVLLVIGIKLWAWQSERARIAERERAMAALKADIKKLGGKLEVDAQAAGKPVTEVNLSDTRVGDEDMVRLTKLPRLKKLNLSGTNISDVGAEYLERIVSLRVLNLSGTKISYAGFKKLKSTLPKAKIDVGLTAAELDRDAKQVQAIFEIRQLGGKIELDAAHSGKPVIAVDLSSTRISDADLSRLKAFPLLQKLNVGGTHVTDDGLTRLKGLANLETLLLGGTMVTDAGIPHLTAMRHLKHIFVYETRITYAGIKELHDKLPGTTINRW